MSREQSVSMTEVTGPDIDKFSKFVQIGWWFIRYNVPNELVKSFKGGHPLCSLHRKNQLISSLCDHETVIVLFSPVVIPNCIEWFEWNCFLDQNVSVCWQSGGELGDGIVRDVDVDKISLIDLPEPQHRLTSHVPWCEWHEERIDAVASSSGT